MHNLATMGHNNPPSETEILKQRLDAYIEEQQEFDRLNKKEIPDEIVSDEQAGLVTDYIKSLKGLNTKIVKIHKDEKAPFLEAGRAADTWKNEFSKKIDGLVKTASTPVLNWNRKKEEAERKRQLEIAQKAKLEAEALAREAEAHAEAGIDDTANELMDAAIQSEQKADMINSNAIHGVTGRSRGVGSMASNRKPWTGKVESRAALDLDALRNYFTEAELERALKAAIRNGVRDIRGATIYQEEKLTVR